MELIIYLLIFIMGSFFGSFFTLAVYRIPLKQDITHEHSFCPNCHHKLGIADLIPIFSYLFLGGKCRYCKTKIRPRYFLLEIFSGVIFLLLALSIRFEFYTLEISKLVYFIFGAMYISTLFIIAGIDKEKRYIPKSVLLFGIITATIYMIYLYVVEKANIYRYVIYLALLCILLAVDTFLLKKKGKNYYWLQVLTLVIYTILFTGEYVFVVTCLFFLLCIPITIFIHKITSKRAKYVKTDKQVMQDFRFGFYFCTINLIVWIVTNFYITYICGG
mgnify:CR=1 FL=1